MRSQPLQRGYISPVYEHKILNFNFSELQTFMLSTCISLTPAVCSVTATLSVASPVAYGDAMIFRVQSKLTWIHLFMTATIRIIRAANVKIFEELWKCYQSTSMHRHVTDHFKHKSSKLTSSSRSNSSSNKNSATKLDKTCKN